MSIGKRIREARQRKGLSQEALAKAINSTKQAIYKYESGIVTNIPPEKIEKMAAALSVFPAELMGWPSIAAISHPHPDNPPIDPETFAKWAAGNVTVSFDNTADKLVQKIARLDETDRTKIEAYADGLLAADKYQEPTYQIKIAARGGGVKEITVTDSQLQAIKNLPEVTSLEDLGN